MNLLVRRCWHFDAKRDGNDLRLGKGTVTLVGFVRSFIATGRICGDQVLVGRPIEEHIESAEVRTAS